MSTVMQCAFDVFLKGPLNHMMPIEYKPRVVEYKQTSQCFVSFCISVTSHHESGVYKFAKSFAS